MGCSKCNCSPCKCGCTAPPFYSDAEVCAEDNCQKIYVNQFSFSVCPELSWNIPQCGFSALLTVPGLQGATVGAFIWHPSYGYYEITSIDVTRGLLGIVNKCTQGNAAPGTQVAACTCFVVTDTPNTQDSNSSLFPFVAIDFTAPANGDCIDITVTTTNGIVVGDTVSIGTGFYQVTAFVSPDVITICNDGQGIAPGTSVIAQDAFGTYVYPIVVTSNCCVTLPLIVDQLVIDVDALEVAVTVIEENVAVIGDDVTVLQNEVAALTKATDRDNVSVVSTAVPVGVTIETPVLTFNINNPSLINSMFVYVSYDTIFEYSYVESAAVTPQTIEYIFNIQRALDGGVYNDVSPLPTSYIHTILGGPGFSKGITMPQSVTVHDIFTILPFDSLQLDVKSRFTNVVDTIDTTFIAMRMLVTYIAVAI